MSEKVNLFDALIEHELNLNPGTIKADWATAVVMDEIEEISTTIEMDDLHALYHILMSYKAQGKVIKIKDEPLRLKLGYVVDGKHYLVFITKLKRFRSTLEQEIKDSGIFGSPEEREKFCLR